jgi:hypothetical protein
MKHYRTVARYRKSKGDGYWTVKIDENGCLSCNCPSWIYKVGGQRNCQHLILAREEFGYLQDQVREHGLDMVVPESIVVVPL